MPVYAEHIKSYSRTTAIHHQLRKRKRSETGIPSVRIFSLLWKGLSNECDWSNAHTNQYVCTPRFDSFLHNDFFTSDNMHFYNSTLFECLFKGTTDYDSASWIIAFALVHRVLNSSRQENRLKFLSAAFHPDYSVHFLFTMFCISFKWHLDCSVALDFLVDILPLPETKKKVILSHTLVLEREFLFLLNFQCNVTAKDLILMLEKYLISSDCDYAMKIFIL